MHGAMWPVLLVILVALCVRLVVAGCTGLGIDESYMVAAASSFAPSYFDHPLASWWLELGSRGLFGGEAPWVVRLPFVVLSAVSSWLVYVLAARLYGHRAGFWALVAFTVSPVFSLAFGCWVLPDGPLDAALLAAVYAFSRALGVAEREVRPEPRWWWAAGFFAGLAMLSKYNAALVLAGAAMVLLSDQAARGELRRGAPWGAAALAVLMFSPVIYWNFCHGWQSFHYQGERATGLRLHPFAPLTIWGGEALFVLPWLWVPMVVLLGQALWRGPVERRGWMLGLLAMIPILLFALVGIWSSTKILYHWAAPGYLMLFPLLGDWLAGLRGWVRNAIGWVSGLLLAGAAALIVAVLNFNIVPNLNTVFAPGKSPLLQAVDWTSINADIPAGIDAVAALRWYDAGKIGYALQGRLPVTVFGPEPHEFGISTPPGALLGKTILLVAMPGDISAITRSYAPDFKSLNAGPALVVAHAGKVLLVIPTLIGTDLQKTP
jgi:4-amino-4-deoxy-L-arabinose transferase-like glycosyltransferase